MKSVGIALGGGGAKGLAHIAILESLDEMGVPVSAIAGTSIGAIIGVAYAAGKTGAEIRKSIEELLQRPRSIKEVLETKRLFGWLDLLAVLAWSAGMYFEVVGDWQLTQFRRQSAPGDVLDSGLWRYTRHPNYFGEALLWWGIYLAAVSAGAWWTVASPLLMTFLLLRVSGVALLEKDMAERRPAYRDYVERTSAFLPAPPRRVRQVLKGA